MASKIEIGLDLSKRILDNQLSSIDQLQTKVGVLLGFAATALGVIFALGRSWVTSHFWLAVLAAAPLVGSAVIFGISLRNEDWLEAPDPAQLVAKINNPAVTPGDLEDWATGNLLGAFLANGNLIRRRFFLVNLGIALMLVGMGLFVLGAFVP